jgi:hypothetical protein
VVDKKLMNEECSLKRGHFHSGESDSLRAREPVAFAECSPSSATELAVKLCVDGQGLGDQFAMNNATDVKKHDEHGLR